VTAPPPGPAISALVVSLRDSQDLRRCLARVREQAEPLGAEVVLVINAAEGSLGAGAASELRALCHDLAFEPRTGKSHGLNAGVAHCRGEVIAFTDDDAVPRPGWLAALTAPLLASDRPPHRVGAGGPVTPI
jgi:GT2 family glycosyltransferase